MLNIVYMKIENNIKHILFALQSEEILLECLQFYSKYDVLLK